MLVNVQFLFCNKISWLLWVPLKFLLKETLFGNLFRYTWIIILYNVAIFEYLYYFSHHQQILILLLHIFDISVFFNLS